MSISRGRKMGWAVAASAAVLTFALAWALQNGASGGDVVDDDDDGRNATSLDASPAAPAPTPLSPATPPQPGAPMPPAATAGSPGGPTQSPRTDVSSPAPTSKPLERLVEAPPRSVWALSPDMYEEGILMDVEFRPYGYGPESFGKSVVVAVASAQPRKPGENVPEIAGRNAVFLIGQAVVETGGRYAGVVTTELRDDRIVWVLQEVRALE